MPNWIEGTLKVRGEIDNVKRFFFEGLNEYSGASIFETNPQPDPKEKWLQIEDDKEYGYYAITFDCEPHVEGTRRAFVTTPGEYFNALYYENGWTKPVTSVLKVRQAWSFNEDEWREISEKYDVDLRLYGIECGLEFCQEIEIIKGEITLSKEVSYEDWNWECPFPYLGG